MIIGTAGHIDHGKTSLVRVLTGIDTDRLKEEKKRGISIDLGFAYLPGIDDTTLGFVDVPGHEKFVHNMLAGATGIDFVLLVVAADDGVMPQTAEHLAIVDLLGVEHGIVAITKADMVSPERLAEVKIQVANTIAPTGLRDAEIVAVSSITGEGIDELRAKLFFSAAAVERRPAAGRFRLAVDRSFTLPGAGTVVTGTVLSGRVAVGDPVVISPSGLTARVRAIHAQNKPAEHGIAGDRCALNLAGEKITKEAISRGDVVMDPGLHAPTDRIDVSVRVLPSEQKPLTQWMPVRLHHASSEVGARVVLLQDEPAAPGQESLVQLVLEQPIAAATGDRFVLRDTTAQRTIAGGRFLDLRAPSRKRRTSERIAQLRSQAKSRADEALAALLEQAPGYVELTAFTRDRALGAQEINRLTEQVEIVRLATPKSELVLSLSNWTRLKQTILAALERYHKENPDLAGIGFERLRMQMEPRLPAAAFSAVLEGLARGKEIALDGAWVRLASHEVRLTPQDDALWKKIEPMIGGKERFRPPRVRDIATVLAVKETEIRRLFKVLSRMGKVDEVAHDHFFLRGTVAEMVEICCDVAAKIEDGSFNAAQLRDRLDNGRKVAIQILEFFDRHGVTIRRGDLRRINKHRLDLFRRVGGDEPGVASVIGRASSPVGRPDFKSGKGREPVLGGFDSHSLPPDQRSNVR
jgi:selenocysteine-specific elongation factor